MENANDAALSRLINMTNQTCIVALDKTLSAIRRSESSYAAAAARVGSIAERITRAAREVGMTLPPNQRSLSSEYTPPQPIEPRGVVCMMATRN